MKRFLQVVKGFLIGIANIIPGVSGGTIAVLVGVFDTLVYHIGHFFEHPWRAIKALFYVLVGMILGVLSGYFLIGKFLLPMFPMEMSFLFAGLIIGGIPVIFAETKEHKKTPGGVIAFSVSFLLLIALALVKILWKDTSGAGFELNVKDSFLVFFLGAIAATSMIIPGISGSVILLALGYYTDVINLIGDAIDELIHLNFQGNLLLLLIFAVGVVLALVLASKLISMLLKKQHYLTYSSILGLVGGSSIAVMIIGVNSFNYNGVVYLILHIVVTILLFGLGIYLGGLMSKMSKKEINFEEEAKKYLDDGIKDLTELLKFKSVLDEYRPETDAPFGEENKKCLEYMLNLGLRDGFTVKNVDNYAGHISYGHGEESIGILGHLDVVPAVGEWKYDPFDPVIEDGKIIARGTLDDKGAIMAAYYAVKMLKDLKLPLQKEVRIIVGCDEESGSRCLEHYFQKEKMPTCAFSPDADFPVIFGEKGILTFDITGKMAHPDIVSFKSGIRYNIVPDYATLTVENAKEEYVFKFNQENGTNVTLDGNNYQFYGKASHAMQPECGINAAVLMFQFMKEYYPCDVANYIVKYFDTTGEKQNIALNDELMHNLTINLGVVNYDGTNLRLGYNLRVPTDEHVEVIRQGFQKALGEFKDLVLGEFDYSPRHFVDPQSELVTKLMDAYQTMSGDDETEPFTIGGGTYARIMENAVAFGPNFPWEEDICHEPNEFIKLNDFVKWIAIYAKAIYELAK